MFNPMYDDDRGRDKRHDDEWRQRGWQRRSDDGDPGHQHFGGGRDSEGWYGGQSQGGSSGYGREGQRRGRSGSGRESSFNGGRFDSDFDRERRDDQRGQAGRQTWEADRSRGGGYGHEAEGYGHQDWGRGESGGRSLTSGYGQQGGGQGYSGQPMAWGYAEIWMVPGPHTGRGPRGYQRSDDRIYEDVCERLTHHGEIDASDVDVHVRNGEVTLRGTVDHRQTKRLAEDVIEDVSGVRDIHNQLRVRQGQRLSFSPSAGVMGRGESESGGHDVSKQPGTQQDQGEGQGQGPSFSPSTGVMGAGEDASGARDVPHQSRTQQGQGQAFSPSTGVIGGDAHKGSGGRSGLTDRSRVRESMQVVGPDGGSIGQVQNVRDNDFRVSRPSAHDVFVPFDAIRTIDGDRIMLSVRAGEVDAQHWTSTEMAGSNQSESQRNRR